MDPLSSFRGVEGRAGVLLDFDGTLSPIVARPELARIRDGARDAIARLVGRYAVVAIVSGRTGDQLRDLVGVDGVRLAALYGLADDAPVLPVELLDAVSAVVAPIQGTRVEPKGGSVAVHFRAAEEPLAAHEALVRLLTPIAAARGLELLPGKMVLELVPAGRPLKEGAVERIVEEERLDAVLYAGDDVADIRAFEALDRLAARGVHTLKVAVHGRETPVALSDAADMVVDGPAGLVTLLRAL
ncbi:MAG TPA: trehalose-phosphatase [Actinomycetota bacterium]